MSKEYVPHFKTRARLLCQLGEQLIGSESIALLELIKNSYDADADFCNVFIEKPDNSENGSIVIQDNGEGMNRDILENVWLEVGTNYKAEQKRNKFHSKKYNRIPLGEKGIGRFGAHRLGKRIELITRRENEKEYVLRINWDKIDESKYIEDVPIVIEEREPNVFVTGSGTKVIISKLRNTWSRGTLRGIARSVNSLNSPFESEGAFHVSFKTDNDWLKDLLTFEDIRNSKLYSFETKIAGNQIVDFSYDFTPYESLTKVTSRHLSFEDIKKISRLIDDNGKEINLSKYKIGEVVIKGVIFDLDSKILGIGLSSGKKDLKEYLNENGGIKVFRNNMRIWNYGEADNDWLDLDSKRINRPSFKLSNRQILAAVYLNSELSVDLQEKTNREGFVENEAYYELKKACSYLIEKVEFFRNKDKELLHLMYSSATSREKPVIDSIDEIKEIVKKEIPDVTLKEKINKKLDRISDDYTRITDNLMKSAGAGLNLIAVLHQIEKIVKNLKDGVKSFDSNEQSSQIIEQLNILANLVDGYSVLVRNSNIKKQPIKPLIKKAIDNTIFRFLAHKIKIISEFEKKTDIDAICSESYIINALLNLFDNSIWWLGYSKTENPTIFIDVSTELSGFITIIVADNGPGFAISKEELGVPFVSAKPSGLGMGIGLHLTREIMNALKGRLLFPESEDFCIPTEFRTGAIVALALRREK